MSGRYHSRRRGNAMIEFAFGFMLFLVLVLGLMEMGRMVWAYTTIAEATRQGARYAVTHGSLNPASPDQIAKVVQSQAVGLDPGAIKVDTTWNPSNTRGAVVQVKVRYTFLPVTSTLILPGKTVTLGAKSQMIVAN